MLPRAVGFWLVALIVVLVLCAASAPTPLYAVYQGLMGFPTYVLTALYGVFALAGLATLLTSGRLSDHIGRRPVLLGALGVQIAGMLAFIAASDVLLLFIGRVLTGLATGAALGAASAWLLDLQPPGSILGSLMNGVSALLGLAAGALVFWVLIAVYVLSAVVSLAIPDPTMRRSGWRSSLRPALAVPLPARPMFVAAAPSMVGTFALTGLYLSLGPSLVAFVLQTNNLKYDFPIDVSIARRDGGRQRDPARTGEPGGRPAAGSDPPHRRRRRDTAGRVGQLRTPAVCRQRVEFRRPNPSDDR